MVKKEVLQRDQGKEDITLSKLIFYNLLFLAPISVSIYISLYLGKKFAAYLQASPAVISDILMLPFTLLIFFFIVPYIRNRENVRGVRYALIGFLIVGVSMTIPPMIVKQDFGMFLNQLLYLAGYILVTFIYCPEVLGMDVDLKNWFKHNKQLLILLVYGSIVLSYVIGFGEVYYSLATDNNYPNAFSYSFDKPVKYGTFLYYSIVTFVTVGYGDITPLSTAARLMFSIEAMLSIMINTVFIAILLVYVSNSQAWAQKGEEERIKKEEKKIEEEEKEILEEEKYIKSKLKKRKKSMY